MGEGRTTPTLVATATPSPYGRRASASSSSPAPRAYASAVSKRVTPASAAVRSRAIAAARSAGAVQTRASGPVGSPGPSASRIVPYPIRRTGRSPPSWNIVGCEESVSFVPAASVVLAASVVPVAWVVLFVMLGP